MDMQHTSLIEQSHHAGLPEAQLMNRVFRVLHDLSAAHAVSDAELRQHAADCARLMTDAEREAAIVIAGKAVEKHMAVWHSDGCLAAKGSADRALRLMEALIKGRSVEQVARMERELGLA